VIEVSDGQIVRVSPVVLRSVWHDGPADAVLIIASHRLAHVDGDVEIVPDFWPE
jgi:hypothetical protein